MPDVAQGGTDEPLLDEEIALGSMEFRALIAGALAAHSDTRRAQYADEALRHWERAQKAARSIASIWRQDGLELTSDLHVLMEALEVNHEGDPR